MAKKSNGSTQRRRRVATGAPGSPPAGRDRLREEFRSYARAVILEAGEDVMASQGLHAARMEEVAQKARVAVGTIYNLIGDRDALVVEILKLRHEQIISLIQRTLSESEPLGFRAQTHACLSALLQYFREHRRFFQMALESEHSPACSHKRISQETLGRIRDVFQALIEHGVRSGALRPEVQEIGATLLMGMMREVIMSDVAVQHPSSPEERVAEVLSVFIEGAGIQ